MYTDLIVAILFLSCTIYMYRHEEVAYNIISYPAIKAIDSSIKRFKSRNLKNSDFTKILNSIMYYPGYVSTKWWKKYDISAKLNTIKYDDWCYLAESLKSANRTNLLIDFIIYLHDYFTGDLKTNIYHDPKIYSLDIEELKKFYNHYKTQYRVVPDIFTNQSNVKLVQFFKSNLENLMLINKISYMDLELYLEVEPNYFTECYKNGKLPKQIIQDKLARLFNVTVDDLSGTKLINSKSINVRVQN